jgi:putative flippase GtrA
MIAALSIRPADMRFFAVSVAAFLIDFTLALVLREVFTLRVSVAAVISFIVVWISTYFAHEYWTFKRTDSKAHAGRLTRNLLSNMAALTTRFTVIFLLELVHPHPATLLAAGYLLAGAGCSFTLNYILNRFWVFKRK